MFPSDKQAQEIDEQYKSLIKKKPGLLQFSPHIRKTCNPVGKPDSDRDPVCLYAVKQWFWQCLGYSQDRPQSFDRASLERSQSFDGASLERSQSFDGASLGGSKAFGGASEDRSKSSDEVSLNKTQSYGGASLVRSQSSKKAPLLSSDDLCCKL